MTIKSTVSGARMSIELDPEDGDVRVDSSGFHIYVTPEDFAREVTAANIPGLTVTYEKPSPPLPTEPGAYADRVGDIWALGSEPGARLIPLGTSSDGGRWEPINEPGFFDPKDYAPFVRLIPASDADL